MKTAVILCFVFAVFQAKVNYVTARAIADANQLEPEEEECVKSLNLNKAHIISLNNEEVTSDSDNDFNTFTGCVWQKMGYQNSNGDIDYQKLKELMKEVVAEELGEESPMVKSLVKEMMVNAVTNCQNNPPAKGASHGQTAVRLQNCMFQQFNELVQE